MKKAIFLVLALALVFGMTLNAEAVAGIADTFHDFSRGSDSWNLYNATPDNDLLDADTSQMCVFCHHPHRSTGTGTFTTNMVLWNQVDQNSTYVVYNSTTSSTINGTASTISNSSGVRSYLCMACHDGDIATGALVATPGDGQNISSVYNLSRGDLGASLEDDHPVNIIYANGAAFGNDVGLSSAITNSAVDDIYPLYDEGAGLTVQCASCHDVHDGQNTASTGVQFMRSAGWETGSAICVACHTNK